MKKSRTLGSLPPRVPFVSLLAKICHIEADPEAASIFFDETSAIVVRVGIMCGNEMVSSHKSRTLINFEDEINCVVEVPLTEEQYGQLVLGNGDPDDDTSGGNHISIELTSVSKQPSTTTSETDGGPVSNHAGETLPLPFLDQLDGLLLPTAEPERPRELAVKLKGKTQAVLLVKLWSWQSKEYQETEAAIAAVDAMNPGRTEDGKTSTDNAAEPTRQRTATAAADADADEVAITIAARALGIDPASEPHLLWIAREAVETPPPPFWVQVEDDDHEDEDGGGGGSEFADPKFQNVRTGAVADSNPAWEYFHLLTRKERQRMGSSPTAVALRRDLGVESGDGHDSHWIRVGNAEGRYYYNFEEGAKVEEKEDLPEKARVWDALPSIVEPYQVNGSGDTGSGYGSRGVVRTLTFYTWWKEQTKQGMKRYTTKIMYDLATQNFIVSFQDSHDTVTLNEVIGRNGPLTQWDLRVTGVIDLLGRNITLMQCDESTLKWLDHRGRRLVKLREAMKREVMKYDPKLKIKEYTVPPFKKDGKTDLRTIIRHVEELFTRLSKYRASLAKKMLQGYEEVTSLAILAAK